MMQSIIQFSRSGFKATQEMSLTDVQNELPHLLADEVVSSAAKECSGHPYTMLHDKVSDH